MKKIKAALAVILCMLLVLSALAFAEEAVPAEEEIIPEIEFETLIEETEETVSEQEDADLPTGDEQPEEQPEEESDEQPEEKAEESKDEQPEESTEEEPTEEPANEEPTDEEPTDEEPADAVEIITEEEVVTDEALDAVVTIAPVALEGLTYTGEPQALVDGAGYLYSLDGENFSEEIPTAVNAGEYTVQYRLDESEPAQLTVTIAKADVVFTPPTPIVF